MIRKTNYITILLFVLGIPTRVSGDSLDNLVRKTMASQKLPGCSIAVILNGKLVRAAGYGLASVELNVPSTDRTVYELGSVTKQFTAMAILMLQEEGKLKIDSPLGDYLQDIPDIWKTIPLKRLLTHTSGIPNYTEKSDFAQLARNPHTSDDILKFVNMLPLDFTPGEKFVYSNTNYYLLGMVVEKLSEKPLITFMKERIFTPLGMIQTRDSDPTAIIPGRASGYRYDKAQLNSPLIYPSAAGGAGFLVSTVRDMALWDQALTARKLLKPESYTQMFTAPKLNNGTDTNYALGWMVINSPKHSIQTHTGGTAAFASIIQRYPDDHLTVIILANSITANVGLLASKIAGVYVPSLKPELLKEVPDPDVKRTLRLKGILMQAYDGKLDSKEFAPVCWDFIKGEKEKQAQNYLQSQGKLNSFTLVKVAKNQGMDVLVYRAKFTEGKVLFICSLDDKSKIAGLYITPDTE